MRSGLVPIVVGCAWLLPAASLAQSVPGRVEVTLGATWIGTIQLPGPDALEADKNGDPYRLFGATSELQTGAGFVTRLGVPLGTRFVAEMAVGFATPELGVRVSADVEGADSVHLTETLSQLHVEAGVAVNLRHLEPTTRSIPFVTVGAGYLRELHEGQTLGANGQSYYLGGGLKRLLRTRQDSWVKAAGLRLDARLTARNGGAAYDDRVRFAPALGASLFLRF